MPDECSSVAWPELHRDTIASQPPPPNPSPSTCTRMQKTKTTFKAFNKHQNTIALSLASTSLVAEVCHRCFGKVPSDSRQCCVHFNFVHYHRVRKEHVLDRVSIHKNKDPSTKQGFYVCYTKGFVMNKSRQVFPCTARFHGSRADFGVVTRPDSKYECSVGDGLVRH